MIEILHCLYDVEFKQFYVRNSPHFIIPEKFISLLMDKGEKWNQKKYQPYPLIPFTVGLDSEWTIYAIAIVHPWDIFNKGIGESIVKGRLARQRGEFAPQRWEYNRLINSEPPYMICHNINVGDKTIIQQEEL